MIAVLKRCLGAAALVLAIQGPSFAQATLANMDPDADFKLAKELYQKEQFSLAYPLFKNIADGNYPNSKLPVSTQLEAKYYTIVAGLKMGESTAEAVARTFIDEEHNEPRIQMLSYQLGEYYYRNQKFEDALTYYEKAGIDNLSNRDIADMKFHNAKPLFNSIRQIPSDPNHRDANYYFGFISFYEKSYPMAMESFRKVESQPTYQKIVPYYIAQILYFQGDKDKAIEYGEAKLNNGGQYYNTQLQQLIGHAYFEKKNYKKALPYLQEYVSKTDKVRREDLYELSYTYYQSNQLAKAIPGFKELGGKEDSLAQN